MISLLSTITLLTCVSVAFSLVLTGGLSLAEAFALYILIGWYLNSVSEVARSYHSLASVSINIKNYHEVLEIPDEKIRQALDTAVKPETLEVVRVGCRRETGFLCSGNYYTGGRDPRSGQFSTRFKQF